MFLRRTWASLLAVTVLLALAPPSSTWSAAAPAATFGSDSQYEFCEPPWCPDPVPTPPACDNLCPQPDPLPTADVPAIGDTVSAVLPADIEDLLLITAPVEEVASLYEPGEAPPTGVVAYSRVFQEVDAAGMPVGDPISQSVQAEDAAVSDPVKWLDTTNWQHWDEWISGGDRSENEPAGETKQGLYLSIYILRLADAASAPKYRWRIGTFWKWTDGAEYDLQYGAEHLGTAYAGGLAVLKHNKRTFIKCYWEGCTSGYWPGYQPAVDDAEPNAGMSILWDEPDGMAAEDKSGGMSVTIGETKWQDKVSNAVSKFYHTFATISWSVSVSRTPSLTISPTNNQWSLAVSGWFHH